MRSRGYITTRLSRQKLGRASSPILDTARAGSRAITETVLLPRLTPPKNSPTYGCLEIERLTGGSTLFVKPCLHTGPTVTAPTPGLGGRNCVNAHTTSGMVTRSRRPKPNNSPPRVRMLLTDNNIFRRQENCPVCTAGMLFL